MASLSQQLRQIASGINQQAQSQMAAAQGANTFQTQQAMTQAVQQPQAPADATKMAQQFAPAVTQAQSQASLQAQQQAGQQQLAATQMAAQEKARREEQKFREEQLRAEVDIAERQRAGELKQNSAELRQAKELDKDELAVQQRISAAGYEYDNRISFLTRKQREDLAALGGYIKQQVFDSRLQFDISEGERRFSNTRQLADFAVLQAENQIDLDNKMRVMKQSYEKESIILKAAQAKIEQRLKYEFQKAEQDKDQALVKELYEKKRALDEEIRRKKAQGGMVRGIISTSIQAVGAFFAGPTAGASVVAATAASSAVQQSDIGE